MTEAADLTAAAGDSPGNPELGAAPSAASAVKPGGEPGSEPGGSIVWRRLHPLSPLLRGGLGLILLLGLLFAALRSRLLDLVIPADWGRYLGPDAGDVLDLLIRRQALSWVIAAALAVIALIVLFSWISWRVTTFRITPQLVEVRSGVLIRQHRRAPIDRIQGVDLERPLLVRALGLAAVTVQTAGTGGRVALRYVTYREAVALREEILGRVRHERDAASVEAGAVFLSSLDRRVTEFIDDDVSEAAKASATLVSVPLGRLVGSIFLSWDFAVPALLAVAAIVAGAVGRSMLVFLVVPFTAVAFAIVYGQFNRGFRFVLSRGDDGVRTGSGLTNTLTETVPFGRIHAIEVRQPLGWRPFGWWRVRITTAGQAAAQSGQGKLQNTVLPVGTIDEVLRVMRVILPGVEGMGGVPDPAAGGPGSLRTESGEQAPATDAWLRPALIGVGSDGGFVAPGRGSWLLLWWGRRRAGVHLHDGTGAYPVLAVRHGGPTRSLQLLPLVRTQSIMRARPPAHRLLGLATIQAHTVPGPVRVQARGLAPNDAERLFAALAETAIRVQRNEGAAGSRNEGTGQ